MTMAFARARVTVAALAATTTKKEKKKKPDNLSSRYHVEYSEN